MNRFIKGLSYTFSRNLGRTDRIIRTVISLMVLASWWFGVTSGIAGTMLGIFAVMILGTAVSARCGVTYWLNGNTMSKTERKQLDAKNINYE